ncbi:hypothetical protein [Phaeobacter italicus]|jgi:hypothetical protein|uniref:hypothetical protein n=1 Tax=Phaeobacter italicus TaxID=481446 RepID=UPI002FDC9DA5
MDCLHCNDTGLFLNGSGHRSRGYPFGESSFEDYCSCSHGRDLKQEELAHDTAPAFPSSVLVDASIDAHDKKMKAAGKHQCKGFIGAECTMWIDEPGRCHDCEAEYNR